jgi:tRNA(Ile)-lysidine synthetase-like protein
MSFFESVYTFWQSHPECWFPITTPQKKEADALVARFFCTPTEEPVSHKGHVGKIIFYDQFFRHFQRHFGKVTDEEINEYRRGLLPITVVPEDEFEVVWTYMPLKHLGEYDTVLQKCLEWPIRDDPLLSRFFCDTYKKAYPDTRIKDGLVCSSFKEYTSDPLDVCDFYPSDKYKEYTPIPEEVYLKEYEKVVVSLSGGVDSMTLLYLLKRMGKCVIACHVVYGNRDESEEELEVVQEACASLGVPLYIYRIEHIRRVNIDRAFYEEMTRKIRFAVYKAFGLPVLLGHIRDDTVENVWTNFARGQHLFDLKKMHRRDVQDGVEIHRPFLDVPKERVFEIAHTFGIPYLKNTTPTWCNRGKFRNTFYAQIQEQYGNGVDKKVLEVADTFQRAGTMIDRLLYKPIFDSFKDGTVCITRAVELTLTPDEWSRIFEYVCHIHLKIPKPSIHSIKQFVSRIRTQSVYIPMSKYLRVRVFMCENEWYMECMI